jgi:DNA-binding response OmpR family regulator
VVSALSLIDSNALDGALLDVSLGNEECYPVADKLRARGVPFAFATGFGAGVATRFQDSMVLSKPFDFETVRNMVAKLVSLQAVRAEP